MPSREKARAALVAVFTPKLIDLIQAVGLACRARLLDVSGPAQQAERVHQGWRVETPHKCAWA
jgi:hypothetical protein